MVSNTILLIEAENKIRIFLVLVGFELCVVCLFSAMLWGKKF